MPTSTFPSPDGTLGAVQIGFIVSTFLFGIVTLQTFNYYWNYPQDSVGLKLLVGVIWLLEVGHSICGWAAIYSISITYYGQPQHILNPPAVLGFLPLFSAIPIVLVQVNTLRAPQTYPLRLISNFRQQWFFCLRIGRLSGRWHFARLLALFCAIPTVLTVVIVVMFELGPGFATLETGKGRLLMTIATSLLPSGHILLAGALCYYLRQLRYPSEFDRPRTIVDNIMIWTIETTLLIW
ncbi:hypothetical protein GGX14DRAFT_571944 [Mycena pura]|uniref:Uncharacterized protein n=1 Tax=Mycena pura TaxID=153505 RepID=A0AAD6Y481_9AGAR|nr:hypothetical protein GGX14DRAFT_571944 [Mycena pura]